MKNLQFFLLAQLHSDVAVLSTRNVIQCELFSEGKVLRIEVLSSSTMGTACTLKGRLQLMTKCDTSVGSPSGIPRWSVTCDRLLNHIIKAT